jgi:hypothetical protein
VERYSSFPLSKLAIVQPPSTGIPGTGPLDPARETLFDPVQGVLSFLKTVIHRHFDVTGDWEYLGTRETLSWGLRSIYVLRFELDREFEEGRVARDLYSIVTFVGREDGVMSVVVSVAGDSGDPPPPDAVRKAEDIEKDILKNDSVILESPARVLPNGSANFRFSVTL